MDIDRPLTRTEEDFLHGKCHLLAVALHRATGLPIGSTLDVDMQTGRTVLVHAYLVDGTSGIDVRGRFDRETIATDFLTFDPWEACLSEEEVMLLGSRRRKVDEDSPAYRKACELAAAIVEKLDLPRSIALSATA